MDKILNFFRNKKIFITGHTGFKGSWLTHLLNENGAIIKGFSKKPITNPNLYNLLGLDSCINSVINDINSYNIIEKEIFDFKPDFIFHLAAQPLVRYSYSNSLETHNTNIIGTANVLEATKKLNNKCIIICITTDKVYKNQEWEFPYRETDELGGYDPYSSSKAAAELLISSYRQSFFTNNIIFHSLSFPVGVFGITLLNVASVCDSNTNPALSLIVPAPISVIFDISIIEFGSI
jgi:CDP-glucose 4,6-dehydratase